MELVRIYSSTNCMTKSHWRWPSWYTQLKISWMLRMQLLPRKRRRLNERKLVMYTIQGKALVQRRPRWGRKEIKMARRQDHLRDDIPTTLPWILHLTKCWCKSKTTSPWNGQRRWKEIPTNRIKVITVASIEITDMTRMSVMTWSSKLKFSLSRENWKISLDRTRRTKGNHWKGKQKN